MADTVLSKSVKTLSLSNVQPSVVVAASLTRGKLWSFKPWELRLLDCINRGMSYDESVAHLQLENGVGQRLLASKKAREYLADRVSERLLVEGWTQERWLSEGLKVWNGEKQASREQMEAWKEIGQRIAPKPERKGAEKEAPVININIGALDQAERRQKVVEIEAINGTGTDA